MGNYAEEAIFENNNSDNIECKRKKQVFVLEMEYIIEADSKEEALELFENGEYSDMQTIRVYKRTKTPSAIHISYSIKNGYIKYRVSDGSTGSEPHVDTALFEKYWVSHYKDSEVTFEQI